MKIPYCVNTNGYISWTLSKLNSLGAELFPSLITVATALTRKRDGNYNVPQENKNTATICQLLLIRERWNLHKFALSKWGLLTSLILSLQFIADCRCNLWPSQPNKYWALLRARATQRRVLILGASIHSAISLRGKVNYNAKWF